MRFSTLSSTAHGTLVLLTLVPLTLVLLAPTAEAQDETYPSLLVPFGFTLTPGARQELAVAEDRPDLLAPLGVIGAHFPQPEEWRFSYRYMRTQMEGLVDGSSDITPEQAFAQGYTSVPTEHVREEHLFSLDYGINERWGLSFTLPWLSNDMDFEASSGASFGSRTIGIGDFRATGMYSIITREDQRLHVSMGLSVPSGSHDETDTNPAGDTVKLPYALQPGSGTLDLSPGISYSRLHEGTSWGAQLQTLLRVGDNSDGYTLGDTALLTSWVARRFREDLSGSLRVAYNHWQSIDGQDAALDPTVNPANDPGAQGGDRVDILLGLNYTIPGGHMFSAELGGPLFQDLNGPQLETDVIYSISWQISF